MKTPAPVEMAALGGRAEPLRSVIGTTSFRENYECVSVGIRHIELEAACQRNRRNVWQAAPWAANICPGQFCTPVVARLGWRRFKMKDFANAAFPPEVISVMETALDSAVASLPEPVTSAHVQILAEAILRAAHGGERDATILQRLALLELQIVPR